MQSFGHGSWLAIEQLIAERAGSEPLTIASIQSAISKAGGSMPCDRAIREQIAADAAPKGKTRDAYELFWSRYESAIPLSHMMRLADIDDCEQHEKLRAEIETWQNARNAMKKGLERELHIFLRAQALKASHTTRSARSWPSATKLLSSQLPPWSQARDNQASDLVALEKAFQVYRASYRFADLLYDGIESGLLPPNGYYTLAWSTAHEGRQLAGLLAKKAGETSPSQREGRLILRALFDVGAASSAEQQVALALLEKDDSALCEWAGKLKEFLKLPGAAGPAVLGALKSLDRAFRGRRSIRLARDEMAFVMASHCGPISSGCAETSTTESKEEIMGTVWKLQAAIERCASDRLQQAKEEWKRLTTSPVFINLTKRGLISQKGVEDVLRPR
jgi:hypothetical protein